MLSKPNKISRFSVKEEVINNHKSTKTIEPFYLINKSILVRYVSTLEEIRTAMINVILYGSEKKLECRDIVQQSKR